MRTSSPSQLSNSSSRTNSRCLEKTYRRSSPSDLCHEDLLNMNQVHDRTVLNRITWFDANLALNELYNRNTTSVNRTALKIKSKFQSNLYDLGSVIQRNAGLILFAGILIFLTTSIGIKSINYENNFENLWVEGRWMQMCCLNIKKYF